jgi:YD repeat-containing protein
MSTTSADPVRLSAFVDAVPASRDGLDATRSDVAADLAGVVSRCDAPVDVPAVANLSELLGAMGQNEVFVRTVRDALVAADANEAGLPTIPDGLIENRLTANGVATPPVEVTVDDVTLVGIPPTSGYVDDPICAANGNMIHQERDLEFPAIAGALNVVRTFNSLIASRVGAFGAGWSSVFDMRIETDVAAGPVVVLGDGAVVPFVSSEAGWVSQGRREIELSRTDDGGWVVRVDPVRSFVFDADGVLTGWRVGVAVVDVERDTAGRVAAAREQVTGRSVLVGWDGAVVASLSSGDGREVWYRRDADGRIVRVESEAGWVDYQWDGDLLVSVTDPDGVCWFANVYDDAGRVVRQASRFGRVTEYRYGQGDTGAMTVIDGDDGVRQAMVHDRRGNLTRVVDVDGSVMRFTYDDQDRVIEVVERDGATWRY